MATRRRSAERQRLRTVEDAGQEPETGARPERPENPRTARILGLQGSAGNRAVAQLLRSTDDPDGAVSLQRQPADKAPRPDPADERGAATKRTMSIKDFELEVPLQSFAQQLGNTQPRRDSGQVVVTIALKDFDVRIHKAATDGRHFDEITIALGERLTLTLKSVLFSNANVASEVVILSLDFATSEVHRIEE